ncbi:MAG TPA: ROK family protein [Ktedonosporobacter sp.]|jgi:glucokinase|nr:ROK family protein [Ktedonosporobacter sp.]
MGAFSTTEIGLGLDIGGTSLRAALVNSNGEVIGPFIDEKRDSKTIAQVDRTIRYLLKVASERDLAISHIGVGLAGVVDPETRILVSSASMTEMEGINFEQELASMATLPVVVNNDANAAGYGEWRFGAGRGSKSCVAVFIGTGVGGAIILNGRLLTGVDGVAGEIGHMILDVDGPACPCGGRGCLEQLGSGGAIVKATMRKIESGERTALKEKLIQKGSLSGEDIAQAAINGDELASRVYKEAGTWIGVGIATLANLLNMEVVTLGGGVMAVSQLIMPSVLQAKDTYTMGVQKKRLRIVKGYLGRQAGTIGAATLAQMQKKLVQ